MKSALLVFVTCVAALLSAGAQTYDMNLNRPASNWVPCALPACNPGSFGVPTKVLVTETGSTTWPANSLEVMLSGPRGTNLLVFNKVGATNAAHFMAEFWVFPTTAAYAGAYEYDLFAFNSPYEYMWGTQCVVGKTWDVWDQLHGAWIHTSRPCDVTQNKWHHIQQWVHRVGGDMSCAGFPCMYYDMLGVDGVYTLLAEKQPAGPMPWGWTNTSGMQIQLDINDSAVYNTSMVEYLQYVNLTELGK